VGLHTSGGREHPRVRARQRSAYACPVLLTTQSNKTRTVRCVALLALAATSSASATAPVGPVGGPQLGSPGLVVNYPTARVSRLPDVAASSFVVADARSGHVLAAKDAHGRFLPASTLKVLTAVALLPVLDPEATTIASRRAVATVPNVAGLVAGQSYRISDLFTALLTMSANDAAIALAEAPGSYAQGIALMNATAARLQARDTRAVDPNGLDAPGQLTSAYDLALIARQALAMPAFMHYDQVRYAPFPVKPGHSETVYNQNTLLTKYPGGIGGKIGWTSAAGATYIGLARRGGVTLIATLMHCPAQTEITSAEKLLDWGFAVDGKLTPVGTLVPPVSAASAAARAKGTRPARLSEPRPGGGGHQDAAAASPGFSPGIPAFAAIGFAGAAVAAIGLWLIATRRARARRAR
jgi:D-alanyl-D-alanine carboxypeptidase (penicillin-binding protein 5/6)